MKKLISLSFLLVVFLAGCQINTTIDPELSALVKSGKTLGLEASSIQIQEFSDFQCPYCARGEEINKNILKKYPQQVKIVYRHFPLEQIHENAVPAALASECAREQGKFWEYASLLFQNQNSLQADNLKRFASSLSLDTAQFDACLDTEKYQDIIDSEKSEGFRRNITGTPAYFVGDTMIQGANEPAIIEAIESLLNK